MPAWEPNNRLTRLLIALFWCGALPTFGAKLPQTISWGSLLRPHLVLNRAYQLDVSASSGLPVLVTVQSGPAFIANGVLTATNLGMVELKAEQPGDESYDPASTSLLQLNHTQVEFTQLARLPELADALDVCVAPDETLAFLPSGRNGVAVVDVTNPAAPVVRSRFQSGSGLTFSRRVAISGDLTYVLDQIAGLEIWNLQDPEHPARIGATSAGSGASFMEIANGVAYLGGDVDVGLRIVDVRDPFHPVEIGTLPLEAAGYCAIADADHLFVGSHGGRFLVINVRHPNQPKVAATLELEGDLKAIERSGEIAILTADFRGLVAINIGNPGVPALVGRSASWATQDITSEAGMTFLANAEGTVDAIDTGTPGRFLLEGRWPLPVQNSGITQDLKLARSRDVILVTGSLQGLVAVRARRGMAQVVESTLPNFLFVDNPPIPLKVSLSSELPALLRLVEGPATTNNGMLAVTGSGTLHLRLEQEGNEQFLPLAKDYFIPVYKLEQQLAWSQPATNTPLRWNVPVPLEATSSSGLPIQYSVKSGPAVIENGTVRATQAGRIILVAEQRGDDQYSPVSVERSFNQAAAISEPVGRWPQYAFSNNVSSIAAYGSFAVAGHRTGLQVIDLNRPEDPIEVATIGGGAVIKVEVIGQTAWVNFGYEVRAIDLTDPRNPTLGTRLVPALPGYDVAAIGVKGTSVYLAGDNLDVFDVSAPEASQLKTSLDLPGIARAIQVSGPRAYVATTSGLHIFDLTTPMAPSLMGSLSDWNCRDVWVEGERVYVVREGYGLGIIDVSNPSEPQAVGTLRTPGTPWGVREKDATAFVSIGSAGIQPIDVSNPASPKLLSTLDTPGQSLGLAFSDNYLLVADGTAGIQIVNVDRPGDPARVGGFVQGTAYAVKQVGQTVYLANGTSGLEVLDAANPYAPRWIGRYDSKGTASDVEMVGNRAFLADGSFGLVVLDLSNPASPLKLGELDTPGAAWHVRVVGDRAYVADGAAGLQIIDVSNPATPKSLGRFPTQGFARRVDVVGLMAYVADTSRGLLQVRVSDPASPTLIQRTPSSLPTAGIFADGDRVFGSDGNLKVQVTPGMSFITTRSLGGVDVFARGNRVYAAAGDFGFRVIDVTDPLDASVLGTFPLEAYAQSIRVSGDLAFVANDRAGLKIQRIREGVPQVLKFEPPSFLELTHQPIPLEAIATSGLSVTIEVVSGPAILVGNQLTLTNAGIVVVQARQAGDEQFLPSKTLQRTIQVSAPLKIRTETIRRPAPNQLEFHVSVPTGLNYSILSSSDLVTWQLEESKVAGSDDEVFSASVSDNRRYYRLFGQ